MPFLICGSPGKVCSQRVSRKENLIFLRELWVSVLDSHSKSLKICKILYVRLSLPEISFFVIRERNVWQKRRFWSEVWNIFFSTQRTHFTPKKKNDAPLPHFRFPQNGNDTRNIMRSHFIAKERMFFRFMMMYWAFRKIRSSINENKKRCVVNVNSVYWWCQKRRRRIERENTRELSHKINA